MYQDNTTAGKSQADSEQIEHVQQILKRAEEIEKAILGQLGDEESQKLVREITQYYQLMLEIQRKVTEEYIQSEKRIKEETEILMRMTDELDALREKSVSLTSSQEIIMNKLDEILSILKQTHQKQPQTQPQTQTTQKQTVQTQKQTPQKQKQTQKQTQKQDWIWYIAFFLMLVAAAWIAWKWG